jgi:photosystem II stability/assembly factor-like uncharacterized protein
VYRFVPSSRLGPEQQEIDAEHVAGLEPLSGARMVVASDGSLERAEGPGDDRLMGGVPVPEHLGRGFLFWTGSGLYRARTFTGKLEPVAAVSTNVVGVEFGPSSLLLFTPDGPPRAYALEPVRRVPLSPHGVLEIAAADAQRALAFDAAGRSLATSDGGRSWKDVTAALGEVARGLKQEAHEVGFSLEHEVAWLEKDGGFVRRPLSTTSDKPAKTRAFEPLNQAVLAGLPFTNGHALAVGDGIWGVELATGQAKPLTKTLPYGSSCSPVSVKEEVLLICFNYDRPQASMAVVSAALSEHPAVEKVFQRTPPYSSPDFAIGDDVIIIGKSCSGAPVEGVACARSPSRPGNGVTGHRATPAAWTEVNLRAALGATWEVLYWVPTAKGGVAAMAMERTPTKGSPKLALIDAASGVVTPFDVPIDGVAPRGFGQNPQSSFVVLENGTLRGFTRTSALFVDAHGHVATPARTFKDVASAGAFALAQDEAGRLWQTTDYGEHWVEVARPPFEPQLPAVPPKSFGSEISRSITCSLVGCVLAHESSVGTWLRVGWSVDPPRANEHGGGAGAALQQPAPPLALPAPDAIAPRPKLRCTASSAPMAPGRPLLSSGTKPKSTGIEYRDVFSRDTLLSHALRGVVRVTGTGNAHLGRSLAQLASTKAPFDVEVVPPLDPAFRTLRAQGSLATWTRLLKERAPSSSGENLRVDLSQGKARPLLSPTPGRADGVLLVDEDFSLATTQSGKIHPIRPGCLADSGYVDAHGTLFVTCADSSGATALGDADQHKMLFRLPPAERFRYDSGPGMHFFEPGRQLLTDPDAIAVAPSGKLAIVRSAAGSEPSTVDTPAWLLSADAPPVELAPWSSLEPATSPACKKGDGYRALIQTAAPWIELEGARFSGIAPGMNAIVRWSPERVCLEAVELGFREQAGSVTFPVLLVARFTAQDASAAFVGSSTAASVHEVTQCEFVR